MSLCRELVFYEILGHVSSRKELIQTIKALVPLYLAENYEIVAMKQQYHRFPHLVSTGYDYDIITWDVMNKHVLQTDTSPSEILVHLSDDRNVGCQSPDGRYSVDDVGYEIRIWDFQEGKPIFRFDVDPYTVDSVCFSGDGQYIALVSAGPIIRIWNADVFSLLHTLHFNNELSGILSFCISSDGRYFAWSKFNNTIDVVDLTTQKVIFSLQLFYPTKSLCFSPDGNWLVSGSDDKMIRLWNIKQGCTLVKNVTVEDIVLSVCYLSDGRYLASSNFSKKEIKIWTMPDLSLSHTLKGHSMAVAFLRFVP